MARLTRRGFITASSALAAAPALTALRASAQGPAAPDIGNLKVERDIVFAKAGTMDMKLDVYQPAAGVTSKRTAIIHLFGGGFFSGNKSAGYIINDIKALAPKGYTNISANYRLAKEGFWPSQIHDVKAAIRWTLDVARRMGVASVGLSHVQGNPMGAVYEKLGVHYTGQVNGEELVMIPLLGD